MKIITREYDGVFAKDLAKHGQTVLVFSYPELETEVLGHWAAAKLVITGPARLVNKANKLLDELEPEVLEQMHAWQREAPERKKQTPYERLKGSRFFIKGFALAYGPRLTGGTPTRPPKRKDRVEIAGWSAGRTARLSQRLVELAHHEQQKSA